MNYTDVSKLAEVQKLIIVSKFSAEGLENIAKGLIVDAAINENVSLKSVITSHQVERGADISDHIRLLPKEIEITGIVTNTPIEYSAMLEDIKDIAPDTGDEENEPRSVTAFDFFDIAWHGKLPCTIYGKDKVYENYYILMFKNNKNLANAGSLEFTVRFKEVEFVETEEVISVSDKNLSSSTSKRGQSNKDKGKKKKKTPNASKTKKVQDLLTQAIDKLAFTN